MEDITISKDDLKKITSILVALLLAWSATVILASVTMAESWVAIPFAGFNFLLHESGHLLADFFTNSELIRALSGTIFELIFVSGIIFILIKSKETIAYVFSGAWIAAMLSGIARYMADAQVMELELFSINPGSSTDIKLLHDWEVIFSRFDMLDSAFLIASFVASFGIVLAVPLWYRGAKRYWSRYKESTDKSE